MKTVYRFICVIFLLTYCTYGSLAQSDKSKRPSPPKTASGSVGDLNIVIDYGAPYVKGRTIFDASTGKEPYGKVWRTGANEATTFSVNKDVTINGTPLASGKYALFTIPNEDDWTVILNKNPDQWGAYDYDSKDDVLKIKVRTTKSNNLQEQLMFRVDDDGKVTFAWEYVTFDFMVKAK